jgi:hypothetical protein
VWNSDIAQASVTFLATVPGAGVLRGRAYRDGNANGRADAGEAGLAGWVVYHDANGNGRRDAGEPAATTDAAGSYRIDLPVGSARLRLEPAAGWLLTGRGAAGYAIPVTGGAVATGFDFGALPGGRVQGTVYEDRNRNGRQDAGERPLSGWLVYLDANGNGRLDPGEVRTTTDALGNYQFLVFPGAYRVRVVVSAGYADPGGYSVTVAAGGSATVRFGVRR